MHILRGIVIGDSGNWVLPPLFISFDGNKYQSPPSSSISLPRDVKEAVSKNVDKPHKTHYRIVYREWTSNFLWVPIFGIEKTMMSSTKKKGGLVTKESLGDGGPTRAMLDQSNRELARLFCGNVSTSRRRQNCRSRCRRYPCRCSETTMEG
jgi:hypothetical protein